jgi:HlyD family secretion protein
MKPYLLLSLLAVAAILSAGCGEQDAETVRDVQVFTVARGDLVVTLTESGTLEARNRVVIRPKVRAQILSIVEQGTKVKAGDILAELDKEEVEDDIDKLEDNLIQLESDLKSARTDLEIQVATNAGDVEKADRRVRFSKLELQRYLEGDHKLQLREMELKLEQAKEKYEKMPRLLEEGFVTAVEVEEKKLAYESAELELENYNTYTHPMTEEQKRADVAEADRELIRVKAQAEARIEAKTAVLRQKERQHEAALQKLEEAKERLGNLTIIAPQDGIVIYGGRRDRRGEMEEEVKVGGTAYPGRTLIELPDLTLMDVQLQVHQADVRKLRKGLPALITFPDKSTGKHKGTLTEIGSVAQSTSWRDPVKRFDVTVQLDERVEGFRAGVTVEVEIDLGALEDILFVPLQAVASTGSGFSVFLKKGDEIVRRGVRLGRSSDLYVQVLDGLAEGEQVLLTNPELVSEEEEEKAEGDGDAKPVNGKPSGNGGGRGRPGGR